MAGTFDDQPLTVYRQKPATLGHDRYLLTNPSGLRELHSGLVSEISTEWRGLTLGMSMVAEKSRGATNPGDAALSNDPGILGSLLLDPNTAIHATGRSFFDGAYVGKIHGFTDCPGQDSSWAQWWLTRMVLCLRGSCWLLDCHKVHLSLGPPCAGVLEAETVLSTWRIGTSGLAASFGFIGGKSLGQLTC
jgi:hypothetical protein